MSGTAPLSISLSTSYWLAFFFGPLSCFQPFHARAEVEAAAGVVGVDGAGVWHVELVVVVVVGVVWLVY